jgi:hypothetical protein
MFETLQSENCKLQTANGQKPSTNWVIKRLFLHQAVQRAKIVGRTAGVPAGISPAATDNP